MKSWLVMLISGTIRTNPANPFRQIMLLVDLQSAYEFPQFIGLYSRKLRTRKDTIFFRKSCIVHYVQRSAHRPVCRELAGNLKHHQGLSMQN